MHRTRNAAYPRGYPGFESLPLRQKPYFHELPRTKTNTEIARISGLLCGIFGRQRSSKIVSNRFHNYG